MEPLDISPLADHLAAPRGRGRLADAPHAGSAGGAPCGDLVRIAIALEHGRVADAGFDAHGCAAARAAGSAVVELVRGEPLECAFAVTPDAIAHALGGLSPVRMHAAELAADALHQALGSAARDGAARLEPSADRTLVAMSGGVDSAVAAWLALERGDEVIGVTLELWSDPGTDGAKSCCSPQAVTGARALAHRMGIPHVTLDVRDGFRSEVVDDFISEQAAGRTPNPCVRCNGLVRFDAMLELASRLGAARLATGHYARIDCDEAGPLLRAGADDAKDQAYMLARLAPSELDRLWFPLGELDKPSVRGIAREAGLPVAEKPESQDLCFLAGTRAPAFLTRHGGAEPGGQILDLEGNVVGEHGGQRRFTVGQRRGIGVAAREPLYVVAKDPSARTVTVGPRQALATREVSVADAILYRDAAEVDRVKLRYRSAPAACKVSVSAPGRIELRLEEPVLGVAPGQTACLMRGDQVIGWGTIALQRERAVPLPIAHRELMHAR